MADLKEETTVDQVEETVTRKKAVDPNLDGIQLFYEKNKNVVNYVGGGLLILIAAFLYFKLYYLPEQENEAANEMFWAQTYFDQDSFAVALKGGKMVMSPDGQKQMMGFEQVAEEYGMTKSGKLANYYAGICHLRTGKFEQAIDFLKEYNGNDQVIAAIVVGAIGDCYMELNNTDDALKFYLKAADKNTNSFTTPYFLKKAGFTQELKGDYKGALESYERILKEYQNTNEGRDIAKDIAKVKTLGNI